MNYAYACADCGYVSLAESWETFSNEYHGDNLPISSAQPRDTFICPECEVENEFGDMTGIPRVERASVELQRAREEEEMEDTFLREELICPRCHWSSTAGAWNRQTYSHYNYEYGDSRITPMQDADSHTTFACPNCDEESTFTDIMIESNREATKEFKVGDKVQVLSIGGNTVEGYIRCTSDEFIEVEYVTTSHQIKRAVFHKSRLEVKK